jgi:hypothetical protein
MCHGMSCRSRERLPAECARSSSEKWSLALLGTLRPMKKNELQHLLPPRQQIPFSADQKVVRRPRPGRRELLARARSPPIYGPNASLENFLYRSERFQEIFRSGI